MAYLNELKLDRDLPKPYGKLIKAWQLELLTLQQCALRAGVRAIVNFEGMDAAGKGGTIRRLVEPLIRAATRSTASVPPSPGSRNATTCTASG